MASVFELAALPDIYRAFAGAATRAQFQAEVERVANERGGVWTQVSADVAAGLTPLEAFRKHPGSFPPWQTEILAAGEAQSSSQTAFRNLATILTERATFWKDILRSLAPAVALAHLTAFLMFLDRALAGNVRQWLAYSAIYLAVFYTPLLAFAAAWKVWGGRPWWRERVPLARSFAKARFSFFLGSMMRAGVSSERAMELSTQASGLSPDFRLAMVTSSAEAMTKVVALLEKSRVFSRDEIGRVQVAELSGRVAQELSQLAVQSQAQWQSFMRAVASVVAPSLYLLALISLSVRALVFWLTTYIQLRALLPR